MFARDRMTTALCAIGLLASGTALAADAGYYLGGSVGQSRPSFDTAGAAPGVGVNIDSSATAWKILGGYQFDKNWGVELNYVDFGKYNISAPANGTTGTADLTGWGGAVVGTLPLGSNVSLLGKLGVLRSRESLSGTFGSGSDSKWSPNYGLGLKYDINANLSGRLEVERFTNMGSNTNTISSNANVYTVGLTYKF